MARSRRSATRSEGPQSPPKQRQVASSQASESSRRSTRNQEPKGQATRLKTPLPILPIVEEEIDDADTTIQDRISEQDDENDLDSISLNGSDSTDDNEEWLLALDHELIIDSLASLYNDAVKLVSFLKPALMPGIIDELKSDKSSIGRRFKQLRSHFNASLQPYRPDDGFLPNESILRKLTETCGSLSPDAAPDAILQLANLAILADDVIVRNDQSKLHFLANSFPGEQTFGAFGDFGRIRRGQPKAPVTNEIIKLATSLRTQFFLLEAAKHQKSASFDPDNLLGQAFYDDDEQVLGFENQDDETIERISTAYDKRIQDIRSRFSENSKAPVDLKKLQAQFPSDMLFSNLVSWINHQKDELTKQVMNAGGAEAVSDLLQTLSNPNTAPISVERIKPTVVFTPSHTSDRNRNSSARLSSKMQQLRRIKAQREIQDEEDESASQERRSREPGQEIPQSPLLGGPNSEEAHIADDSGNVRLGSQRAGTILPPSTQGSVVPSQKTAMILQVARRQAAQSNKENIGIAGIGRRFIDKQKGAKRVDWDDDSQEYGGKRQHQQSNEDDDEDDFEIDIRQHKRPRTSQSPVTINQRATREEPEDVQGPADDELPSLNDIINERYLPPASTQPVRSRSPLQVRSRPVDHPPASSAPSRIRAPEPAPSMAESFPRASQAAQANVKAKSMVRTGGASSTPYQSFKVQTRRAWTVAETERLMDMIALHGTGWAKMLEQDPQHPDGPALSERGQVALKDKARNLKVDFLKAGQDLPPGFEYVKIKASDVEKLKSLGMGYHGGPARKGKNDDDGVGREEDEED